MILEAILAIALHGTGNYRIPGPIDSGPTAVVCGASTVPVYDGASGAVVCESANTVLGAQQNYYPVQAGYGGYFGGYPQTLQTWNTTYYGGLGGLLGGGLFGGHFGHGGFGGHLPACTATVLTHCANR